MIFDFHNRNVNLVKHRKKFFGVAITATLVGIILLVTIGLNLGIDFQSGSRVEVVSKDPLTAEQVIADFAEIGEGYTPDGVTLAGDRFEQANVTFIGVLTKEDIQVMQSYFDEKYGAEPNISTVSPQVGKELARNALYALIIASVGIVIYVALRFEISYGIAAITALAFDAFFVIAGFSLMQVEVNLPFIAAILTVVGYSINDKIVTFDRIRENLKLSKKRVKTAEQIETIVNDSLRQVMSRSINTVITVLVCAIAIFIFGGEAIRSFALALIIGLTVGAFSSIFLAAQLWLALKTKQLKNQKFKSGKKAEGQLS